jgi:hypothetical protein
VINSFRKGTGERAAAELKGFERIEERVFEGKADTGFFVWVSPPGKKEDGFGSHNFTFIGHVLGDRVDMVAYRNWVSQKDNAKFLNKFLADNQQLGEVSSDLDFLANPVFLPKTETIENYHDIIKILDPGRNTQENSCKWLLDRLQPFRKALLSALAMEDLLGAERAKNALDNYGLALLKDQDRGVTNLEYWAMKPVVLLSGSCGFSSRRESKTVTTWLDSEKKYFQCPGCKGNIESGKGITVCPHCGVRKEDYRANSCD